MKTKLKWQSLSVSIKLVEKKIGTLNLKLKAIG